MPPFKRQIAPALNPRRNARLLNQLSGKNDCRRRELWLTFISEYPLRQVLGGIFYLLRSGCSWRLLPREYPPWRTVYGYFRMWRDSGVWEEVHRVLREQVRLQAGREATPSAAILDSQSVKTTEKGGFAAMMEARKSMVANATCSSILWA